MGRHLIRDRKPRFTRLRAVLAGGLVLGVGVTATLAAWTDEEHAAGEFAAGTFSIVGSTNGADYSDHTIAPGSALDFTLTSSAMVPGSTVYALYSVKTKADSVGGSVQLIANTDNGIGLGAHLVYGVKQIADTTCDAAAFTTGTPVVVAPGATLTTGAEAKLTLVAAGATPVNYCFAVTLPSSAPNAAQGTTLTGQWTFAATTDPVGT